VIPMARTGIGIGLDIQQHNNNQLDSQNAPACVGPQCPPTQHEASDDELASQPEKKPECQVQEAIAIDDVNETGTVIEKHIHLREAYTQ
jgi:hypothetical protein